LLQATALAFDFIESRSGFALSEAETLESQAGLLKHCCERFLAHRARLGRR
jgi:hypothetical protein